LFNKNFAYRKITIAYRVFPMNFSLRFPENIISTVSDSGKQQEQALSIYTPQQTTVEDKSKLIVNGNISRGMSVGNSQDMVMNSNLNLQLSGELSDGLFIDAVFSDKNIPVQPDGYSQQIQEFDQVYIKIYDSICSLQMGDIQLNAQSGYFLRFNKKILGGSFTNAKINLKHNNQAYVKASGAVSKGKFNRINIMGVEGVQGPYRLTGANNETYIVVLSGTERVYIDGVLMQRGENADYVINYNTAELTFTPNRIITKNSRIIVEFEYSDKKYNRFLVYTDAGIKFKKGTVSFEYFSESDAKNQPVNQQLTDEYKLILQNAGDNPLDAVVPNYDSVAFNNNVVLYKMVDTVVNAVTYDSILVYSANRDSAFYRAGFAFVGQNRGNYIQQTSAVNGKVYKWVAPQNGIPQGEYESVKLLVAPQSQRMITARAQYRFGKNTVANIEAALSHKDINTFSDKDADNNNGFAVKSAVLHTVKLNHRNLLFNLNYETTGKNFNAVERFRAPEFKRDWNLITPVYADENLLKAEVSLSKKQKKKFLFASEYLNYKNEYNGFRNSAFADFTFYKFRFSGKASMLVSDATLRRTEFYRHYLKLVYPVWKLNVGVLHDFENNIQKAVAVDSLFGVSRKYSLAEAFISSRNKKKNSFKVSYKNRNDFLPWQNNLTRYTHTDDVEFNTKVNGKVQNLTSSVIWRKLNVVNENIGVTQKNDQNLLARINHNLRIKKRVLSFYTFYEIGTAMENRKEFSYIEVAKGQGIYVWIDYNNNNVPELNEFEVSPFPEEANYIRILIPTKDYIKVYSVKFNETVKLDFGRLHDKSGGVSKFASHFSNVLSFMSQQKHTQSDLAARIIPFAGYVDDSLQMNRNYSIRNTFSFNKRHSKFGADYIFSTTNRKNLLTTGFDFSENTINQLKIRWNISSQILLQNTGGVTEQKYSSEFFSEKNYNIKSYVNNTVLQWQPLPRLRLSLAYAIKNKNNLQGNETGVLQEITPKVKLNSPKHGMFSAMFSYIDNSYSGNENSPVAFTMLEGYRKGVNYRWNLNFTRNVNKFLRVSLSYIGRKPADMPVIHTGQFSVSAFF